MLTNPLVMHAISPTHDSPSFCTCRRVLIFILLHSCSLNLKSWRCLIGWMPQIVPIYIIFTKTFATN